MCPSDHVDLARAKLCPRDPGVCRHLECEAPAEKHVVTPFGTGNFCGAHAAEMAVEATLWVSSVHPAWLRDCFRYSFAPGDFKDAPL